jgi:DNA helicase-2/ATP-dependent DNA helicase PcrA
MTQVSRQLSPAEQAAETALAQVFDAIDQKRSFILEAGAGAGKTYTLVQSLQHIIEKDGTTLLRQKQRVACITYTNVAKDEIQERIGNNPAVVAETIHSFCWSLLKSFQPKLREVINQLPRWPTRLEEAEQATEGKTIKYDLGYPTVKETEIYLGHDDVIASMVIFLENPKFREIFTKKFPILFIDEYQDTDKAFAEALQQNFLNGESKLLIGLFGDHWQKIYGTGCGLITNPQLTVIGKRANFRSDTAIVGMLNRLRPDLTQEVRDSSSEGSASVYHTNNWRGQRRTDNHWQGDLPAAEAHGHLVRLKAELEDEGWDFSPRSTKILMLTHNVLADEQGYRNLANLFSRNESFIKKEDDYIAFLVDVVEAICAAYSNKRYGEMFALLGTKFSISDPADKTRWAEDMNALLQLYETGTVGQVLDHLKATRRPKLTEKIQYSEDRLSLLDEEGAELSDSDRRHLDRVKKLRDIEFKEVTSLAHFIEDQTPFSTKHSVKGAEFDNVLVVIGRGWNQYNFVQMLEWIHGGVPTGKQDTFERNRNLFYVACSRPKKRLALLFTQEVSDAALAELTDLFSAAPTSCP